MVTLLFFGYVRGGDGMDGLFNSKSFFDASLLNATQ